jgi:hypothetical protein
VEPSACWRVRRYSPAAPQAEGLLLDARSYAWAKAWRWLPELHRLVLDELGSCSELDTTLRTGGPDCDSGELVSRPGRHRGARAGALLFDDQSLTCLELADM